ncbi:MAG TPA: M2 family metallopeptidase [Steroidobacteraceae bacterium]|nr:M2 family metallopeptidase [Steroidobacteraceae bacterium]
MSAAVVQPRAAGPIEHGLFVVAVAALLPLVLGGCSGKPAAPSQTASAQTQETADEFVSRVNRDLTGIDLETSAADWTQKTYITPDTELLNARANDRYLAYLSRSAEESKRYDGQKLSPATARSIELLRVNVAAPAPRDPAKRAEMTQLMSRLSAMYGEGKYCPKGMDHPESCRNLDQLSETIAKSRNYDELVEAWKGWHDIAAPMREPYRKFAELANEGARELGYKDLGVMWRARYDMPPEEFDATAEKLWQQVKPLYDALHCHTRAQLAKKYGEDKVPAGKPIPAQLLGNMWSQAWNNIYGDLLKPYPAASIETADRQLKAQKWDAVRITRSAESFYTSLGFQELPATFWQRSMLVRPRDREVVCHASAWDMNPAINDVRIKTCLTPTEEDLRTVYHELGHVYYFLSYSKLPELFRGGANDGFHEAIGDTVNLSVTPGYLAKIGLIAPVKPSEQAVINQQMKMALEKIAFLPFGRLIDQWRWKVFSGEIKPEHYNEAWWDLRKHYQGIAPPVARSEADFDPGAKFHIPDNTPYTRYFLSYILQFQFHKALCDAAGFKGPLHECSVFGSKEAGQRFAQMLALGASEPWQDTLQKLTGTREVDAGPIIQYFQPLIAWLKEQNKTQQCGWE